MKNPNRRNFTDVLPERERRRLEEGARKRDDVHRDPVVKFAQDELARLKPLVVQRWGSRGIIQALKDGIGYRLEIGYYADDNTHLPPWRRKEVIVARGRSYSEVLEALRAVERVM